MRRLLLVGIAVLFVGVLFAAPTPASADPISIHRGNFDWGDRGPEGVSRDREDEAWRGPREDGWLAGGGLHGLAMPNGSSSASFGGADSVSTPEPASLLLLGSGLALAGIRSRRKKADAR